MALFEQYHGRLRKVAPGRRTDISRGLTNILRHSAERLKLAIRSDGYLTVSHILATKRFHAQRITMQEIVYVVSENDKQRFQLEWLDTDADFNQDGFWGLQLSVRAVQGHSLTQIDPSLVLTELDLSQIPEVAAHGTYWDYYKSIIQHGLLAGGPSRPWTHIHLTEWLPSGRPLAGMRDTTDIVLRFNIRQAAAAGIKFYVSKDRVILTEGARCNVCLHASLASTQDQSTAARTYGTRRGAPE